MIHDRLPPEYKAASQMQRAWDYPKIATCPDSGCACSQISVSPSPRFFWQSERGILTNPTTFCRLILIESCRILSAHIENLSARFDALSDSIKAAEKRMVEVQALQQHIKNYRNTRQIYIEYRKSDIAKKSLRNTVRKSQFIKRQSKPLTNCRSQSSRLCNRCMRSFISWQCRRNRTTLSIVRSEKRKKNC